MSLSLLGMLVYSVGSLFSMATMSLGIGFLSLCLIWEKGLSGFLQDFKTLTQTHPWVPTYLRLSAFLVFCCVGSLVGLAFAPLQFGGSSVPIHWATDCLKMAYFFFPLVFLIGWLRLNLSEKKRVFVTWISAYGILSFIGLTQVVTGWPRAQDNPQLPGFYHVILFLGHHLSVASIWIFPFFVCLGFFEEGLWIKRWLSGLFSILGLGALFFTYSRTLWVALPIGMIIWILSSLPRKKSLLLLLSMGISGVALIQTPLIQKRLQATIGVEDRIRLWKANWMFFTERPFLGVGFGKNHELYRNYLHSVSPESSGFVGHAHNVYLELLAGIGSVGALAWLLWVGFQFRLILKTPQPLKLSLLCAWVVLLLNGLTQVNFWEGKVLHQIVWCVGIALMASEMKSLRKGDSGVPVA